MWSKLKFIKKYNILQKRGFFIFFLFLTFLNSCIQENSLKLGKGYTKDNVIYKYNYLNINSHRTNEAINKIDQVVAQLVSCSESIMSKFDSKNCCSSSQCNNLLIEKTHFYRDDSLFYCPDCYRKFQKSSFIDELEVCLSYKVFSLRQLIDHLVGDCDKKNVVTINFKVGLEKRGAIDEFTIYEKNNLTNSTNNSSYDFDYMHIIDSSHAELLIAYCSYIYQDSVEKNMCSDILINFLRSHCERLVLDKVLDIGFQYDEKFLGSLNIVFKNLNLLHLAWLSIDISDSQLRIVIIIMLFCNVKVDLNEIVKKDEVKGELSLFKETVKKILMLFPGDYQYDMRLIESNFLSESLLDDNKDDNNSLTYSNSTLEKSFVYLDGQKNLSSQILDNFDYSALFFQRNCIDKSTYSHLPICIKNLIKQFHDNKNIQLCFYAIAEDLISMNKTSLRKKIFHKITSNSTAILTKYEDKDDSYKTPIKKVAKINDSHSFTKKNVGTKDVPSSLKKNNKSAKSLLRVYSAEKLEKNRKEEPSFLSSKSSIKLKVTMASKNNEPNKKRISVKDFWETREVKSMVSSFL